MLAADKLRQIFCLLLRIPPTAKLIDAKIGMRPIRQTHRGTRAADFFNRNGVFQITQPRAAIGFGNAFRRSARIAG